MSTGKVMYSYDRRITAAAPQAKKLRERAMQLHKTFNGNPSPAAMESLFKDAMKVHKDAKKFLDSEVAQWETAVKEWPADSEMAKSYERTITRAKEQASKSDQLGAGKYKANAELFQGLFQLAHFLEQNFG